MSREDFPRLAEAIRTKFFTFEATVDRTGIQEPCSLLRTDGDLSYIKPCYQKWGHWIDREMCQSMHSLLPWSDQLAVRI
jgi:hypothetical protein